MRHSQDIGFASLRKKCSQKIKCILQEGDIKSQKICSNIVCYYKTNFPSNCANSFCNIKYNNIYKDNFNYNLVMLIIIAMPFYIYSLYKEVILNYISQIICFRNIDNKQLVTRSRQQKTTDRRQQTINNKQPTKETNNIRRPKITNRQRFLFKKSKIR